MRKEHLNEAAQVLPPPGNARDVEIHRRDFSFPSRSRGSFEMLGYFSNKSGKNYLYNYAFVGLPRTTENT